MDTMIGKSRRKLIYLHALGNLTGRRCKRCHFFPITLRAFTRWHCKKISPIGLSRYPRSGQPRRTAEAHVSQGAMESNKHSGKNYKDNKKKKMRNQQSSSFRLAVTMQPNIPVRAAASC